MGEQDDAVRRNPDQFACHCGPADLGVQLLLDGFAQGRRRIMMVAVNFLMALFFVKEHLAAVIDLVIQEGAREDVDTNTVKSILVTKINNPMQMD